MNTQDIPQYTEEQRTAWVREQFQKANKHLAEQGILFESVITQESRYLQPFLAIWKIVSMDKKTFWVITGEAPTDYIPASTAPSAREAVRHFALTWQLNSDNVLNDPSTDEDTREFAKAVITQAEGLFKVYEMDKVWG